MKQTGLQKTKRAMRLVENGMTLTLALESVGLSKTTFWKLRKRLRDDASGQKIKVI